MVYKKGIAMRKFPENDSLLKESGSNRPLNVRMTLRDVLYVSYALPAGRMRNLIPDNLSLATAGDDMSFISIVALHSTQVRLNLLSFLRFKYYQLNIRTYVKDPVSGKHAVYFLKSGVTSRFISLVTRMSGIPWQFIDLVTEINTQNEKDYFLASGNWEGRFSIKAQMLLNEAEETPFFENRETAVDFLVRPLIGFVGNNRRLGRFTIQHPKVEPQSCTLQELNFPLFASMGTVDELDKPHSVFYLPTADFSIYLPPRRIKYT